MQNPTDEIVARLEAGHPDWQVWYVPRATGGGMTWCARRRDGGGQPLNAASPELLARMLEDREQD